jgi:predicted ester cyclase
MTARRLTMSLVSVVVILFAGCQSKSSTTETGGAPAVNAVVEANKAGVTAFMTGMARGDTTVVDSFVAPNMVEHQQVPGMGTGMAGLKGLIASWHAAFPDLQITINDMAADSDKVWVYSTMSGTMKGALMGMKPTGKTFRVDGFDLVRIENGKAVEHWGVMDDVGMMQQLGLNMASGGGKKAGAKH